VKRDIDRLLNLDARERLPGADDGIRVIALGMSGRRDEARRLLAGMSQRPRIKTFEVWTTHLAAWLDGRGDLMLEGITAMTSLKIFDDPEAIFQEGWMFCDIGEHARGLDYLQRAVGRGYFAAPMLSAWSQFDALRGDAAFKALVATAEAGRQRALTAFRDTADALLLEQ
jgi:hypothetical protein